MSLSRQQLTLLGIFALFLGPVILVILMRSSWWQYQPAELKNHGHLVQPPAQLSLSKATGFDGKWLILYRLELACDKKCIEHITVLRQIHRAAGRNSKHLTIVLLSASDVESSLRSRLVSIYPEFQFVTDPDGMLLTALDAVNEDVAMGTGGLDAINTYILDPMHNVILAYGVSANPNDIHKDLKRLLQWSDQEYTQ